MELTDRVVVVTGAARGIGRALALRFAAEGCSAVVVADLDDEGARSSGTHVYSEYVNRASRRPPQARAMADIIYG